MANMKEKVRAVTPLAPLLCALFVNMAGFSAVLPTVPDVLVGVICPGRLECNQIIFLAGLQTTITGLGAMVVAPILGGFSDDYGRKPAILLVFLASILPPLILAYSMRKVSVYLYWALQLIGYILREAGLTAIPFAIVKRAPAIGIAMSAISVGMIVGTLCARVLTTEQLFIFSAVLQILSVVLIKVFFTESHPKRASAVDVFVDPEKLVPLVPKNESKRLIHDTIEALRNSKLLRLMAAVAFMANITETTLQSTLFYYLKAVFTFEKDQFSEFNILVGTVAFVSQMVVYPILAHNLEERGVLWIALVGGAINVYLYAFSWANWVVYLAVLFCTFYAMISPAIATIVSRGSGAEEQGKVQGLIISVRTVAFILGPIILTPLTALFLSEDPPFHAPGFTLMIGGTSMVIALLLSFRLPRFSTPDPVLVSGDETTSSGSGEE